MTTSNREPMPELPNAEHVPAEELVRRQGAQPIDSVAAMARPDLFETDEELDEFLAEIYAARRADV
ncbi:hypothetical protein GCM10023322_00520 [Rugosimonospora acidiphila]|uniref:Uncharacterized protein n=1 Tax=Rugosimonospora acidiphila TaxID=556531 RepID=A0ABP9RGF1_9ACTN